METLPEKELEEIFNVENMQRFLSSLLSLQSDDKEKRRERVNGFWKTIFGVVGMDYGLKLVSKDVRRALMLREERGLQAIYYATLYPKQEEKTPLK